jgi:DNA helicase II / ATP-dependent DNA helicase PcrA
MKTPGQISAKINSLSSPYVFIAGCVQGILPPLPDPSLPQAVKNAQMEESRRLFYVGITRVKADPAEGRPGTLIISYPQQMLAAQAFGAKIAFASQSGAMANLIPSRFIGELGPSAPKPQRA